MDEAKLLEMYNTFQEWSCAATFELRRACAVLRIPTHDISQKHEHLVRLKQVLLWSSMSIDHLQQTCRDRRILFPAGLGISTFASNLQQDKEDLVSRLMQAEYGLRPGELGPLPVTQDGLHTETSRPAPKPKGNSAQYPRGAAQAKRKPSDSLRESTVFKPNEEPEVEQWRKVLTPHDDSDSDASAVESCGPRFTSYLEKTPGFCGALPGDEAELWSEAEIQLYLHSNGYMRPKQPQPRARAKQFVGTSLQEHYSTLGLKPGADAESIRKAYRKLALQHHPDKSLDKEQGAGDFQRVTLAYEALSKSPAC